jgi:hypothetical protein
MAEFNYNTIYQAESYAYDENIHSRAFRTHGVVIDALCAALEGLRDRRRFRTYEELNDKVYEIMTRGGLSGSAYCKKVHRCFNAEGLHYFPLGYFIFDTGGKRQGLQGRIEEHQAICLCPFAANIHYGISVVVTRDGFSIQNRDTDE